MKREHVAASALLIVAASMFACNRADSTAKIADQAPTAPGPRLEMLTPPQLVGCSVEAPFFRADINVVDANNNPVKINLTEGGDSKGFRVSTDGTASKLVYVSDATSSETSQGASVMLLFDASGSMVLGKLGRETRFVVARRAVQQSLTTFMDGVDRMSVVPFASQSVADRIRRATFRDTREGVLAQLNAIPTPSPRDNTALFSAVVAAIPILQNEAKSGRAVALVVFSDGHNDVGYPRDDPDLLSGPSGLQSATAAAKDAKIPIYTIGFGVTGDSAAVDSLQRIAWPEAANYTDAATDAKILTQILERVRAKLSDKYRLFFGPVGKTRQALAGGSVGINVSLNANGQLLTGSPMLWQAPGTGDPASETRCTATEETKVAGIAGGPGRGTLLERLTVLGMYTAILASLWFAAPRFMWPDAYIPRPRIPTMQVPTVAGVSMAAPPSPQMPSPSFSRRGNPPPAVESGGGAPPIRTGGNRPSTPGANETIVIPPSGGRSSSRTPPRPTPQRLQDDPDRGSGDETIFMPPPKRDR